MLKMIIFISELWLFHGEEHKQLRKYSSRIQKLASNSAEKSLILLSKEGSCDIHTCCFTFVFLISIKENINQRSSWNYIRLSVVIVVCLWTWELGKLTKAFSEYQLATWNLLQRILFISWVFVNGLLHIFMVVNKLVKHSFGFFLLLLLVFLRTSC